MPYMQMQLAAETFFALFREGLEGQMVSAIDEHPIENIERTIATNQVPATLRCSARRS